MDEIDRILRTEATLDPPPGFAAGVMAELRRRTGTPQPIAFPWRRAAGGFGACALLMLIAAILALSQPPGAALPVPPAPASGPPPGLVLRAIGALPQAVLAPLALALAGSLAAVRLSLRLAGARD